MLSARDLTIVWSDTPVYWRWVSDPDSRSLSLSLSLFVFRFLFHLFLKLYANRFEEVAELIDVCWLEIHGKIETQMLSPATMYTAYLVFKLAREAYGWHAPPAEVSVGLAGSESTKSRVCLDTGRGRRLHLPIGYPKEREDGWLEVKLGEFFNKEGEDGELEMSFLEVKGGNWKRGLVVQGIEIRPASE